MARVLVTGSTTGLGKAAAQQLLDDGHDVVLHARNATRIGAPGSLLGGRPGSSSATSPTPATRAPSPTKPTPSAASTP
jgi:NAD(P)-dependent dehydrogenase (short-subunit alcohol dehydrogenase family)